MHCCFCTFARLVFACHKVNMYYTFREIVLSIILQQFDLLFSLKVVHIPCTLPFELLWASLPYRFNNKVIFIV